MDSFSLPNLLKSSGKRMRLDLGERLVNHPGELGTGREEIVRQFLRAYLPKRFEVSTGFAFDSKGSISKQLDIIIADGLTSPTFETAGGTRFYPCESIVAVGQVKSSVTSLEDLRDALANLESVKDLDRSAGGHAIDTYHGEVIDHRENHLHQIFAFLFITGDSLSEKTMSQVMLDYILEKDVHVWPNVLIALDKYLVAYCCDDGICPNPMHSRGLAIQPHKDEDDVLMRFYLLLGKAIEVTRVGSLPYWEYLHNARTWSANVYYSLADVTPPYLRSLRR